jgi:large subunit ribosomal protein L14
MIQPQTILQVADNSGAKTVKCIKILNSRSRYASVGDCILVSVRSVRSGSASGPRLTSRGIQKGQIYKALVIRTKKGISNRIYGHSLAFPSNDVVLIDNQGGSIGSRIFGPVTRELLDPALGFSKKIISQAKKML